MLISDANLWLLRVTNEMISRCSLRCKPSYSPKHSHILLKMREHQGPQWHTSLFFYNPMADYRCINWHENLAVLFSDNDGRVLPGLECDELVWCTELSEAVAEAPAVVLPWLVFITSHLCTELICYSWCFSIALRMSSLHLFGGTGTTSYSRCDKTDCPL